jgi:hypothetical protein
MKNKLEKSPQKVNEFKGLTIDEIYHEISEQIYQIKTERKSK